MATPQDPDQPPSWYIQAAGRVWGPYAAQRLPGFVVEKRLAPETPVATDAAGPFHPAKLRGELRPLFEPAEAGSGGVSSFQPPEPAARALLVWARLTSLTADAFEARLGLSGRASRLGPDLWLVQARAEAASVRNALSRHLRGEDALIVVEAPLERAAWFNLDQDSERSLRELWGGAQA